MKNVSSVSRIVYKTETKNEYGFKWVKQKKKKFILFTIYFSRNHLLISGVNMLRA